MGEHVLFLNCEPFLLLPLFFFFKTEVNTWSLWFLSVGMDFLHPLKQIFETALFSILILISLSSFAFGKGRYLVRWRLIFLTMFCNGIWEEFDFCASCLTICNLLQKKKKKLKIINCKTKAT